MSKPNQASDQRAYNTTILFGFGSILVLVFFIAAFLLLFVMNREREVARYPGAAAISSHSNYTGLPFEYRWDDSYLIRDNFTAVYQWYSITFNLGAEARANGDCIQLDSQQTQLMVKRTVNVLLCNTPDGQRAYVTRITAVQR